MITLQSLFNEAETHIQESMNELPVRGNYKENYKYTKDDVLETINILV